MPDPAATLRALADACDRCDQISKSDSPRWLADQRHALTNALPDVTGWTATATALRAMADEVERLRAVIDNPGDYTVTMSGDDIPKGAHRCDSVSIAIPAADLRDHLRARLGVSDV